MNCFTPLSVYTPSDRHRDVTSFKQIYYPLHLFRYLHKKHQCSHSQRVVEYKQTCMPNILIKARMNIIAVDVKADEWRALEDSNL